MHRKIRRILASFALVFGVGIMAAFPASAGDMLSTFLHNSKQYYDVLAIGQITDQKGDVLHLRVSECVVDNPTGKFVPLPKIEKNVTFSFSNQSEYSSYTVGDCIAVALRRDTKKSDAAGADYHGVIHYKITTDDTDTLKVISKFSAYGSEEAVVEVFLRSRGRMDSFYGIGESRYWYYNNADYSTEPSMLIYDEEQGTVYTIAMRNPKIIVTDDGVRNLGWPPNPVISLMVLGGTIVFLFIGALAQIARGISRRRKRFGNKAS